MKLKQKHRSVKKKKMRKFKPTKIILIQITQKKSTVTYKFVELSCYFSLSSLGCVAGVMIWNYYASKLKMIGFFSSREGVKEVEIFFFFSI